ncbi:MAG TPA: hypothetical protein VG798_04760 [Rhizomicrobium sp.]|nr:hypothetical protein [Rhizomicrobium sp.]
MEVALFVRPDGSAELNGQRFADIAMLQAALVDACGQRPRPIFNLKADQAAGIDSVNTIVLAAQNAGCLGAEIRDRSYRVPGPR